LKPLTGLRVLAFVDDIYEDLEVWYPKLRLMAAGANFVLAGPTAGTRYLGKHGYPCVSDIAIDDCRIHDRSDFKAKEVIPP
jgi:protease I